MDAMAKLVVGTDLKETMFSIANQVILFRFTDSSFLGKIKLSNGKKNWLTIKNQKSSAIQIRIQLRKESAVENYLLGRISPLLTIKF